MSVRFGVDGVNSLNQQWSIDREARRHSIPKNAQFRRFLEYWGSQVTTSAGFRSWLGRRESGIEAARATARLASTARVWTIDSHHQIDSKLLFCPAEGSPDPGRRRKELSRATLKAESAAAALFSRRLARTTRLACEGSFLDAEANEPRKHAAGLLLSRSSGSRAALCRRRGLAPRSGRRRAPHHTTTATTTAATHAVFSCVEYGRRDCGALPRGAFSAARRRVLSVGAPRGGVGDGRRLCASDLERLDTLGNEPCVRTES